MNCIAPHWIRFRHAMSMKNADYYEGHAWVNVFAEALRCLGVPEGIIKARIGGRIGLPHVLSALPPWGLVYLSILKHYLRARRRGR